MGYVVHKGHMEHSEDFDLLEEYAAKHRTKVISAELWGFERLPIGQLVVRWKNGAIGQFVGGDLYDLQEYVKTLQGWPETKKFSRYLPYSAGALFVSSDDTKKEPVEEEHVAKRVVRERHSKVIRRTRGARTEMSV